MVVTAQLRLELGNTSRVKWFDGLGEYVIDWGPGYRIYLAQDGERLIVLFGGGIKRGHRTGRPMRCTGLSRRAPNLGIRPAFKFPQQPKENRDEHHAPPARQGHRLSQCFSQNHLGLDEIRLPWPRQFTSAENHFATALHKLVHWTGHQERLHRTFGARFGDAAYAFEELVAELGSAFVMGHCGLVEATVEWHAAYLEAWLGVLRRDRTAIFTAARLAGEAFEFIRAREMPVLVALPALPMSLLPEPPAA